jgi:polar amino acid transport system substrate-binding protein
LSEKRDPDRVGRWAIMATGTDNQGKSSPPANDSPKLHWGPRGLLLLVAALSAVLAVVVGFLFGWPTDTNHTRAGDAGPVRALRESAPNLAARQADEDSSATIYIGSTNLPPIYAPDEMSIVDELVRIAFAQIGREAQIVPQPAERSLINANRGINGGDLLRVEGIDELYPNLVRVPVRLIDFDFVIFTKRAMPPITGWDDLKPYSVAIIRGWKILEENVRGTAYLTKVENAELLFRFLESDRADIIIYERLQGLHIIQSLGLSEIQVVEPPLVSRPMFLYLHKSHRLLIPALERALIQLIQDGTYERIKTEVLSSHQNGEP